MQVIESDDVFALDLQIIADASSDRDAGRGCKTDDGCTRTCASACASRT